MKNKKMFIFFIILVAVAFIIIIVKNNYNFLKTGNNINNKSADEIKSYILNIESYQAIANIKIKNKNNENVYIVKQEYNKQENIYKQEIIEPENMKGIQFEYNGKDLKIEDTKLLLSKIYKDYNYLEANELSLIEFIEDYKKDNNSKLIENKETYILETNVENNNRYTTNKKLFINKEQGRIEKMEIKDRAQNTRIYILYNEIEIQ